MAVRAGKNVFTIDVCKGEQFINFPICNEDALKVIKESVKVYKVSLFSYLALKMPEMYRYMCTGNLCGLSYCYLTLNRQSCRYFRIVPL